MSNKKNTYIAPGLTVVTMATEQGFALSLRLTHINELVIDYNIINNYDVVDGLGDPINHTDPTAPPSNSFWNF